MTLSFRAKLLGTHVAIALAVGAVALLLVERSVSQRMEAQIDSRLEAQALAVAVWMDRAGHPDRLAGRLAGVVGARVTIVNKHGASIGESAAAAPKLTGDKVAELGEFKAARAGSIGRETRYSEVEQSRVRYMAVPAGDQRVVRLGLPIGEIDETKSELRKQLGIGALASLLVALGLAALIAGPLTRRLREATAVAERIGAGDYDVGEPSKASDEVGILSRTLAAAAAELEATDRRRREFLATVAHEIRTPVTSIRGYAETLSSGDVDAETKTEFLGTIHRNAIRIGQLVTDLLELEALEAGKSRPLESRPVKLAAVADNVVETLGGQSAGLEATVEVEIDKDLEATGDADAIERILLNLVDNALRHGGEKVSVVVRGTTDGDRVTVRVADTGPGIDDALRVRIFERFRRTASHGGAGLGLSIARELAQAMGGSLRLEESERGATFAVELPS